MSRSALAPASVSYSFEVMTPRRFLEHYDVHTLFSPHTANESTPPDRFSVKCQEINASTIARDGEDEEDWYCQKQQNKPLRFRGFLEPLFSLIL